MNILLGAIAATSLFVVALLAEEPAREWLRRRD